MTTQWVARLYFFVRVSDLTNTVRNAIADRFAAGSGHTRAQELGMFSSPIRLSLTGEAPAQVFAWNSSVKASMRDEIKTLVAALPQSRYYVVANTDLPALGYVRGELIQTNSVSAEARIGTVFEWNDALRDVETATGFKVIPPVPETVGTTSLLKTSLAAAGITAVVEAGIALVPVFEPVRTDLMVVAGIAIPILVLALNGNKGSGESGKAARED